MRSIEQIENLEEKKVLLLVDFNVPIKGGEVEDDFRIRASLHTINFLLEKGAKILLITHLGKDGSASLDPVIKRFWEISKLGKDRIEFFENIRKFPEEEKNDLEFAKKLSKMGDFYVNDAFSVSHREHASVVTLPKLLPSYAGFQLEKEVENLSRAFHKPEHPFLFILGGAKFDTKIPLIKKYLRGADNIFIGGLSDLPGFIMAQMYSGYEIFIPDPAILIPQDLKTYYYGNNTQYLLNVLSIQHYAQVISDPLVKADVISNVLDTIATYVLVYSGQPGWNLVWHFYRELDNLDAKRAALVIVYPSSTDEINSFFAKLQNRINSVKYVA